LTRLALSPLALLRGLAKNRDLIGVLAAREVKQRFQGSILGVGWSLLVPLVTLVMYTAVFAGVFKLRWPGSQGGPLEFALTVFVGLLVHGFLAECLNRSPALLVGNVNYIKKVVFPLEILAVTMIAPALFNFLAGIVVLLVFAAAVKQALPWTAIWLPLVMAPLVLIGLGIAWIVSPIGVVIRDMGQIVGLLSTALLFLSPVFYPLSALPGWLHSVALLNPLSFAIEQARTVLLAGESPDALALAIYWLLSAGLAAAGFACFQVARRWMADFV
jgi:lipopolysaccharide transport system permease protein